MYINTFKYTPKDVSCQLCTEYVKKLGCTALRCPWLAERIEAGVVGYREAVLETFPHERRLFQRLNLLIKHYPGSLWSNEQHERRMQYQCAVQGYRRRRDTNAYYAAMYLLTSNDDIYRRTAMLLLMIEQDMPIDMVLSADTGMEFPEMYEHLAKLDEHLFRERGIHITTLRHPKGFEYLMFDEPKQKPRSLENRAKLGIPPYGNGWPGIRVRWCTGQLKTHLITKEVNRLKGELGAIHYVGIAADEAWRCKNERYPLVEWGITEAQALQACYDRGFDFGGLYEIYHRASCWCCPFQRIDELRKLRKHHPELWEKLLELDRRALAQFGTGPLGQFKQNWSVKRLDTRFAEEDGQTG